jgi:iron complex transport system substrate-binding protein
MHDAPLARRSRTARLARAGAALAAVALAVIALAGCKAAQTSAPTTPAATTTAAFPVTITDDASRSVTIASQPQRIVSLAPANTEILYALGELYKVVGVTTFDDYPVQVKSIAKMGDFQTTNIEAVAAAKPDVVFVTGGVQADVLSKLEAVGAKVVVVDPQTLDGVYAAIGTVAKVTGATTQGDKVVAGMKSQLASIETSLAGAAPVRAFVEIGQNPLYTAGRGTLLDDLLVRAGGVNVVTQKGYVGYSVEQLVRDQPTVYLGTKSSIGDVGSLSKRPGYSALSALKTFSVFMLDDNLVSRPGPRVVQGVLEIAKALHPDLFR